MKRTRIKNMAVVIRLPDDAVQTILDRLEVDGINSGIGHTSPWSSSEHSRANTKIRLLVHGWNASVARYSRRLSRQWITGGSIGQTQKDDLVKQDKGARAVQSRNVSAASDVDWSRRLMERARPL